jgi:hypothetical protein
MKQWLHDYSGRDNRRGRWSDTEPSPPQCGAAELDATLVRVWRVWLAVVRHSKQYGSDREQLNRLWRSKSQAERLHSQRETAQGSWPLELLGRLDNDLWARSLANGAYSKAEAIRELPEPERIREADALNQKLMGLFDTLELVEIEGESLQRTLEDFLNLPIWKQRHELYSAWVSTQIVNALHDHAVEIHCVEGQLLFEFKERTWRRLEHSAPTCTSLQNCVLRWLRLAELGASVRFSQTIRSSQVPSRPPNALFSKSNANNTSQPRSGSFPTPLPTTQMDDQTRKSFWSTTAQPRMIFSTR